MLDLSSLGSFFRTGHRRSGAGGRLPPAACRAEQAALITFISNQIGGRFVEPPTFDISKSFADSVNTTPLIFILSPGTDPVSDVIAFADKLNMAKRFESISLGQGQGPKAMKLIEQAQGSGGWVLLSNCHLMESWMPTLEAIVEQFNGENMQTSFRLWLTSMPAKSFPVQVLQNGVKMTNEPPSGLRANLLRSYSALTDEVFKESNKPEVFKTLLFGFCFFHAVVQDRRKFGPIGWNIAYGFTPEDLLVCRQQLMLFVNQYEQVPYKVLNFLGAKINYGGRVTDDKDKLLISTILQTYICPESQGREEFKYSTSGLYYAPTAETIEDFVTYIKGLPLYPMPEAFGLHENCNITCAQDEALKLLTGMQSMVSLNSGGGEGGSAETVMDDTAASIQDRLPTPFPLDVCETKFPTRYEESMNTVVKQECLRYNKLLWSMISSLKDFRKAIKGLIVMTAELEAAGKSLFVNEVPEMWTKKGPLSLKPLSSWYLDILERVRFFQMWFDLGHAPPCFWVSGIFFPQAFFTGAMQNFARKYGEEIDLLSFSQHTMDHISDAPVQLTTPPDDGVYVYGIFLEGARFDCSTHQLEDSRPKELFTDMPPLQFLPVRNRVPDVMDYRCPCYKVVSRKGTLLTTGHSTNFVLYIEVKTDKVVDKWIKAGVGLVVSLAIADFTRDVSSKFKPSRTVDEGEASFKESYPMALMGTRDGKEYFGRLSCLTKMAATFPAVAYGGLRYFETGYMKKFYTDDYPRASLSIMSTFLILATLLDLVWDPFVAALTDGTRRVCGRDWGRRRPFLVVASFIVTLFYALGFSPPAILSAQAQQDAEAWYAQHGDAQAPVFNSLPAAVWFGVFHILVKVVSDAVQDIPHGALLVELTPDGRERTYLWSWMEFFGCCGVLLGMILPALAESECASSPDTGCYGYLFLALCLGGMFTASNLFLCHHVKERPCANLTDEAEGFVPSIVGCLSNFPFFILLISDVVEGFGANLPLLVLPYVIDWVVGKEAAEALVGSVGTLFAVGVLAHMVVRVPMNFVWRAAANRWGKYPAYLAYEIFYGSHMFLFLFVTKGSALLGVILCATWGMAYAGHWLLFDLVSDVADYDELLTGQRREGQLTMARELVPKICEIPADALPFLLMSYYGYNPDLAEQNDTVKWIIKGSISLLPGIAGLSGTVALLWFNLRKQEQHDDIIRSLHRHQAGLVATDPLTGLRLPPIKRSAGSAAAPGE
ncbi:unnamed protein product [Effrenium voratum]|nr:unnamed protein product [Effrenium voratum]